MKRVCTICSLPLSNALDDVVAIQTNGYCVVCRGMLSSVYDAADTVYTVPSSIPNSFGLSLHDLKSAMEETKRLPQAPNVDLIKVERRGRMASIALRLSLPDTTGTLEKLLNNGWVLTKAEFPLRILSYQVRGRVKAQAYILSKLEVVSDETFERLLSLKNEWDNLTTPTF